MWLLADTSTIHTQYAKHIRMNVSIISFITLALMYILIIPALIFPKIRNLFQNFSHADIPIFFIEASSKRLENESEIGCSFLGLALSTKDYSAGNIIWFHRVSNSFSEYIPFVMNGGRADIHIFILEIGFRIISSNVSTSLSLNLYQEILRDT